VNNKKKISIILLAAGSSSRMGMNKLMLKIENETLLESTLKSALCSSAGDVIVVFGANSEENESLIGQFSAKITVNEDWEKGIGSTIKCGLQKALAENPDLNAVIISVSDQPFLTKNIFDKLISKYLETGKPIVASDYSDSMGVPVLYDKSIFDELLEMPDEHGAKKHILVNAEKGIMATVPFPKGDVDIDTVEDLRRITPT